MDDKNTKPFASRYAVGLTAFVKGENESLRHLGEIGQLAIRSGILPHQLVATHAVAVHEMTPEFSAGEMELAFEFLTQTIIALEQSVETASLVSKCMQCHDAQDRASSDTRGSILADTRRRRVFLVALRRVLNSSDPKAAVHGVVEAVVPEIADCAAVHWVDANGQLTLSAQKGPSPLCKAARCQDLAREACGLHKVVVFAGPNYQTQIRRSVSIPLMANGQPLGTLSFCQTSGSEDVGFVQEFGEQLACCAQRALESAQYRAVAQSSYEFLDEYLNRAIHDLSSPLGTLSLVLQIGLERLQRGEALNEGTLRRGLTQVDQMTALLKELTDATRETLARSAIPWPPSATMQPTTTE